MTVSSATNKIVYTGDGANDTFAYTFKIYANSELIVERVTISTGGSDTGVLNTHYTLTGVGEEGGGNVTTIGDWENSSSAFNIVVRRSLPLTQSIDLTDNQNVPAATYEEAFDRAVMIAQQLQEQLDRSIGYANPAQESAITFPLLAAGYLYYNGSSLEFTDVTSVTYPGTISRGVDASKAASPVAGDIYVATDTSKVYYCFVSGAWTATISAANLTNCASLPAGSGQFPAANLRNAVFVTGDWILSTVTTAHTGWTNVSATYSNKFIRINATPLTTGGTDAHTHGVGSFSAAHTHTTPNHAHVLSTTGGASNQSSATKIVMDASYNLYVAGAASPSSTLALGQTASDGGSTTGSTDPTFSGTSGTASDVPAYVQVVIFQKD